MPVAVLSDRALNRALLSRQHLLDPVVLPETPARKSAVTGIVEHLVGLQAQAPFPPYYGLWSRLDGFRPGDLAALLTSRDLVRIALMRGTIHLVSARDCLPLRSAVQPVLNRAMRATYGQRLDGVDLTALEQAGRDLVDAEPLAFSQLGQALAARWPQHQPDALAQGVRALVPLVQVPPRALWGRSGRSLHTSAESWLGVPGQPMPLADLVTRYLGAFGPATVRDIQAWSGLTGLRAVLSELRPSLAAFRGTSGAELFDLPAAPRPDPGTPAPVRLVAEFDNLVLSHADRSRIIREEDRSRMRSVNGIVPGTVLIDGFVGGIWRLATTRSRATLGVELWDAQSRRHRDEVGHHAERLLGFAAPGQPHQVTIG